MKPHQARSVGALSRRIGGGAKVEPRRQGRREMGIARVFLGQGRGGHQDAVSRFKFVLEFLPATSNTGLLTEQYLSASADRPRTRFGGSFGV